jgi:VWFA-related protein
LSRFICRTVSIVVFALFFAAGLPAQDVAAPHAPTLTVNARLVVLDVVVTDKSGKPVDNLTRKDFEVFEDKQMQAIRSFEPPSAHEESAAESSPAANAPLNPANPATFGVAPVTILVLDQLNTQFADSSFARRELHDYLAKQPSTLVYPTTLLTVYDNNFKQLQPFTRDRAALLHALAAAPTKESWQLTLNGKSNYGPSERLDESLRALQDIAQSYAAIRGRKNLIWIGGGFPSIDPTTLDGQDEHEVQGDLQHITNLLLNTRITLYAVDPTSSAAGMTEITDESQLAFAMAAGDAMAGGADPFGINNDFDRLGPVTGGRVLRGMNNIAAQIGDAIDLGSNYYTLSYTPTSTSNAEGKYRNIRVVCLRPDLTVSTRNGYYTQNPQQEKSNDTIAYDLSTAAESSTPLNALHVTVEPSHSVAAEEETYIVHVGASALTWNPGDDGASVAHVAIMAVSISRRNKMLGHMLHGMTATARPGINVHDPSRTADFEFITKASPKAVILRFVVRDAASGRMGTFDLPITRP